MGPTVCREILSHQPPQSSTPLCRNLDTIITLPGGESLRGFILVTLLVEKAAVPGIKVGTAVCWGSLLTCPVKCLRCTHKLFLSPEPGLGNGRAGMGGSKCPEPLYTDILPLCDLVLSLVSQAITQALGAILQCDEDALHRALEELAGAIEAMREALRRMHGESSWCPCVLQLITHIAVTAHHL